MVGLLVAFAVATYLSYWGSINIRNAFTYQSAVVAAQRDAELLKVEQFDRRLPESQLRFDEKLLDSDLKRIDLLAETPEARAPRLYFPATLEDYDSLDDSLHDREVLGRARFDAAVDQNEQTRNLSNALFAIVALLFTLVQMRLRRRIEEGQSLVERLQRAFLSRPSDLRNVSVGSVLLSATEGSEVGGDLFDVYAIDERYGAFLVADVSGKGIDAAVDTAFIKYSLRTLLSDAVDHDPGRILTKFAALFERNIESRETFVVLFLGVIDTETGEVRYASAGHEPACARLRGEVTMLEPTGPIVGILPELRYGTNRVRLEAGDMLLVATDGLTESRNARGEELGAKGVREWFGSIHGGAQHIADAVVERLRRRSARIGDDLAILVLAYESNTASDGEPLGATAAEASAVGVPGPAL